MKGLTFRLNANMPEGYQSSLGYENLIILDRSLYRTREIDDINEDDKKSKAIIYDYELMIIGTSVTGVRDIFLLDEKELWDEISYGIYVLA
jgi:hypothetical protein